MGAKLDLDDVAHDHPGAEKELAALRAQLAEQDKEFEEQQSEIVHLAHEKSNLRAKLEAARSEVRRNNERAIIAEAKLAKRQRTKR